MVTVENNDKGIDLDPQEGEVPELIGPLSYRVCIERIVRILSNLNNLPSDQDRSVIETMAEAYVQQGKDGYYFSISDIARRVCDAGKLKQ